MPLYEYHCGDCEETVEVLVRNLQEETTCPQCGSRKLQKLLSLTAAPAISGRSVELPTCGPADATCGRPQCASGGCMFGD